MMENLKELIRKAGHSTVPAAWLMNDAPINGGKSKLERLTDFAEALFAEIAKESEPVAFVQATPDGNLMLSEITKTAEAHPLDQWDRQMGWTLVPLYTFPLSTEQIENRVAEACAKLLDYKDVERTNYCMGVYEEGEQYKSDAIAAIRSGAWKSYMK